MKEDPKLILNQDGEEMYHQPLDPNGDPYSPTPDYQGINPDGANGGDSGSVGVSSRNQKRYRRTANEIPRRYTCWCGKAYGSDSSLNQHKKLKNHFQQGEDGMKESHSGDAGNDFGSIEHQVDLGEDQASVKQEDNLMKEQDEA